MDCPVCRTNNVFGVKYCVRCGSEIKEQHEADYYNNNSMVSADLFSEADETDFSSAEKTTVADIFREDFSENDGFQFDMQSVSRNSDIEIDLSSDEEATVANIFSDDSTENNSADSVSTGEPLMYNNNNPTPYTNATPYVSQQYGSQPVNSLPQPQIIGYYPNGTPIYGQPPVMYAQPQIVGYDPNGMPIYAQPVSVYQNSQPIVQPVSRPVSQPLQSVQTEENKAENEKFRQFIDDGKDKKTPENPEEDFFGKSTDMGDVLVSKLDSISMKKREGRKKNYMEDTPLVDANRLVQNNASKFNKMYMRQTTAVSAENLEEKKSAEPNRIMKTTNSVDADRLNTKMKFKSRIRMGDAENAQIDTFNTQEKKRKKAYMAEADHAVEALPKKKKYVDEIDAIELPEYMKARKTVKKDTPEIPEI